MVLPGLPANPRIPEKSFQRRVLVTGYVALEQTRQPFSHHSLHGRCQCFLHFNGPRMLHLNHNAPQK